MDNRIVLEFGDAGVGESGARSVDRTQQFDCEFDVWLRASHLHVNEGFRSKPLATTTCAHRSNRPPVKPLTVGELAGLAGMPAPLVDSVGLATKGHK